MEGPQSGAGVWGPGFGAEVLGSRFQDQGWSRVWGLGTLDKDEDWGSGTWVPACGSAYGVWRLGLGG